MLPAAIGGGDEDWIAAVIAAIEREPEAGGHRRSQLLVICASGTWFHATFAENRESIMRRGLDWRRMARGGIAGSVARKR